jgi:hypothetical protein
MDGHDGENGERVEGVIVQAMLRDCASVLL